MGKFSHNPTYSDSPSLFPEPASRVISLSDSAVSLGVMEGTFVGCAWFKFFAPYNGRWNGAFGGDGIGESVVREIRASSRW